MHKVKICSKRTVKHPPFSISVVGEIKKIGNLTGVKELTNSMSVEAIAAAVLPP